jgi:DNA (cytosine-5)-methyltransferase 1
MPPLVCGNVQRRGTGHADHGLVRRFFDHVEAIRPWIFIMENVPPLVGDLDYLQLVRDMEFHGYSVQARVIRYADFGAATGRRRLFTVGIRDSVGSSASEFFQRLDREKRAPCTVRDAIGWLRNMPADSVADHQWSQLRTIGRYEERYRTGRFGWRQLGWDEPAPSFGSISKTYILHPAAGEGDYPTRVLSVREILAIMGFPRSFRFPDGASLSKRYHMVANAVSPRVAEAAARVAKSMLRGWPDGSVDTQA